MALERALTEQSINIGGQSFVAGDARPSGMTIANSQLALRLQAEAQARATIYAPFASQGIHLLPSQGLHQATEEDIARFSEQHVRRISGSSEVTAARVNPYLYIARTVERSFTNEIPDDVKAVLAHLQDIPKAATSQLDPVHMHRIRQQSSFFEQSGQRRAPLEISVPGALEVVGLQAAALLFDPAIQQYASEVVLEPLLTLFRNYRLQTTGQLETPEMPDLLVSLIQAIDQFGNNTLVRRDIYRLIEQIHVPPSLMEEVARKMDQHQDLDHPLAFQAVVELAEGGSESAFLVEQQRRREALLTSLARSPQQNFDEFASLFQQAQGLVYAGDPYNVLPGRVGMEVEFASPEVPQGYPVGWRQQRDPDGNWEIKRSDDDASLSHNRHYLSDVVALGKWLRDHATYLSSLHVHFDRDMHQHEPLIGFLLGNKNETIRKTPKNTWEVRGLVIPLESGNVLHPAIIEDAIGLHIHAAEQPQPMQTEKIEIRKSELPLEQIIWGHICTQLKKPEARLAALMALRNTMVLRAINPLAFGLSYTEDSRNNLVSAIQPQMIGEYQLEQLNLLRQGIDVYDALFSYAAQIEAARQQADIFHQRLLDEGISLD